MPRSVDRDKREGRYLITMGFRVACFIGAYFAPGPWRWVLLGAAAILPGIAVVLANAVDEKRIAQADPESPQLGLAAPEPTRTDPSEEVITGEVVRQPDGDQHSLHGPERRNTERPAPGDRDDEGGTGSGRQ